ncbi:hypothetical protein Nepgr_004139 [Nepenthes gracilis]|uniref:Cytochrome c-552/DMSO reductase-like haem-binding domain-containing protein n=1 Tax=Nepenthes gracilis TaxID=150966 RepID=A0AAD3S0T6_NEPGR|nr:hypothetical protein Nepgr_004139 [Nepenthes gracilis]
MICSQMTAKILRFLFLASTTIGLVNSHSESGEWSCESGDSVVQLFANFRPGIITLDGHADDWEDIDGFEFSLRPALDPHDDDAYGAKMTAKALHDGKDVFFLLQVDGEYTFSKGDNSKCPSVALMFQIGENATYHNMGGCKESPNACTSKSCQGYEVDIMHFSIGNAIPGRLYGGNPIDIGNGSDRFGHLVDVYAWNPHCRYLDGLGPSGNDTIAQNDWKGAWWHSSLTTHSGFVEENSPYASNGQKGTYYFEFSRPLRTMDRLQQDVQFKIGDLSKFSAAFWYPVNGNPWHGSGHYTVSCDWLLLNFNSGSSNSTITKAAAPRSTWDAAVAFSLLLSVVAFCLSVFVGLRVSQNKSVPFTPINNL